MKEEKKNTPLDDQRTPFLYMAPIRGITEAGYRNIFHHHFGGCHAAIAPFINPQRSSQFKRKHLKDLLPENNLTIPVIPQILHTDPRDFLFLANRLEDLGYTEVNWNLGCPAPMVAKKKRGSGLLPFPESIKAFLDEVMDKLSLGLSIKTRLGYHSPTESLTLFPLLNEYPLTEIIVHARLGKQLYKGSTDLEGFGRCLEISQHPLVYNGDINDYDTFQRLRKQFPSVRRWMVGRGLIATPHLAAQITEATRPEPSLQVFNDFHEDIYSYYQENLYGPSHLLGKMKQIWDYFITSFPQKNHLLKQIRKAKKISQYEKVMAEIFQEGGK